MIFSDLREKIDFYIILLFSALFRDSKSPKYIESEIYEKSSAEINIIMQIRLLQVLAQRFILPTGEILKMSKN